MKSKVKVGSSIKVINTLNYEPLRNKVGEVLVIYVGGDVGVKFPDFTQGHDCDGKLNSEDKSGWFFRATEVILLPDVLPLEKKKSINDLVSKLNSIGT